MNDTTLWVLIGLAIVVVAGLVIWMVARARRSRQLRREFGPEYETTLASADSRTAAERELEKRKARVARLQLRDLPAARRGELKESWRQVEIDFVDHPAAAVAAAQEVLTVALRERGYPVETVERRPEDLSVEHAEVMDDYRRASDIARRSRQGAASTEDLRQAMRSYRNLFDSVVDRRSAATVQGRAS